MRSRRSRSAESATTSSASRPAAVSSVASSTANPLNSIGCQTRIVSVAGIRLDSRKSMRPFKGIIWADVSEFESYMPSHAVASLWARQASWIEHVDSRSRLELQHSDPLLARFAIPRRPARTRPQGGVPTQRGVRMKRRDFIALLGGAVHAPPRGQLHLDYLLIPWLHAAGLRLPRGPHVSSRGTRSQFDPPGVHSARAACRPFSTNSSVETGKSARSAQPNRSQDSRGPPTS
jgi:hypothetical protein